MIKRIVPFSSGVRANRSPQPRIDLIVERGSRQRIIRGTPTVGARLDNLLGAPHAPRGWGPAGYVLVPQNQSSRLSRLLRWPLTLAVLVTLALPVGATAEGHAHHRHKQQLPFLSVARARNAIKEPHNTVTICERWRQNAVTCIVEWEGMFEYEPGSGNHAKAPMTAILCAKDRIYVVPLLLGPSEATCKTGKEASESELACEGPEGSITAPCEGDPTSSWKPSWSKT